MYPLRSAVENLKFVFAILALTAEQVAAALNTFVGRISQEPPAFSAVKVDGKRAYKRARDGDLSRPEARTVEIHSAELMGFEPGERATALASTLYPTPDQERAEAIGAEAVYIGAVAEDSSGYPDCRPEYYRAFQELVRAGTRPETKIEIATPVITLKKSEIIRRGVELGAPLHLTWSCYQSEDAACGVCDSCLLRLRAFAEAGVPDPIRYQRTLAAQR